MVHTNKTGSKCVDIDVVQAGKRTRVFTCLVSFNLPQQSKPFYLSTIIAAYKKAHPQFAQATNFKITNSYYQPQFNSGSLAGLNVEFVNTSGGTIAGVSNSGTAMLIQSKMKLTNLGWIRGAGGRGGYGGTGGTSALKHNKVVDKSWPATVVPALGGSKNGWSTHRMGGKGTKFYIITPCGNRINSTSFAIADKHWSQYRSSGCGGSRVRINHVVGGFIPMPIPIGVHIDGGATYKTLTVAGHGGGAGGAGGAGIWWKHNAGGGVGGVGGGINAGGNRGGTGGHGGAGGSWGAAGSRGERGHAGGGTTAKGAYGPLTGSHAASGAGKAITGAVHLQGTGSNTGHHSGIIVQ